MKATDFRDATFEGLRGALEGMRREVYEAWVSYGPGTTKLVCEAAGMSILTFRPRTTELVDLGLVEVFPGPQTCPGEGIYQATPMDRWERWREGQVSGQRLLL